MIKTVKVLGYSVVADGLDELMNVKNDKVIVNTINAHSYFLAKHDNVFKNSLLESDLILPDGIGICYAAKLLNKRKIKKIAGDDFHKFILSYINNIGGRVFYMGSSPIVLSKIKTRIFKEYPNIKSEYYSPPFKKEFSEEDNLKIVDNINRFGPDVLFIGMTAPKQEKWLVENKSKLSFSIGASIGAVFDFYAGTISRPSKFFIYLGLEWFIRFITEPKRMWRRVFISAPMFIFDVVLEVLKKNR